MEIDLLAFVFTLQSLFDFFCCKKSLAVSIRLQIQSWQFIKMRLF